MLTLTELSTSNRGKAFRSGFTIVELLIVIVVIAILAALVIVSYNGISQQAKEASLKSDLQNGATQLGIIKAQTGEYPADATTLQRSDSVTLQYTRLSSDEYCLAATNDTLQGDSFKVTQEGSVQPGTCPYLLQAVTKVNCPTSRSLGIDARDSRTYWIQKYYDECWMLTNLAYAGGGDNTYGDVKSLSGTAGMTYTEARYYVPTEANPTTYPAEPSTSIDGGVTNPQYGYFYNYCAAKGAQLGTAACLNASTPEANSDVSICPANWELIDWYAPTPYMSSWMGQLAGVWWNGPNFGGTARYWFSGGSALTFTDNYSQSTSLLDKRYGVSVRCMAVS